MSPKEELMHVIVDWDYDTFYVADDEVTYFLYDVEPSNAPEYLYISGFPYPGKHLENALAKRVDPEDSCKYRLLSDQEVLEWNREDDKSNIKEG